MPERLTIHKHLPDVWDDDESLASDTKIGVCQLNVAGQYQDQLVSRSQLIVVAHWTVQDLVEPGSAALKDVEPKDGQYGAGQCYQDVGC